MTAKQHAELLRIVPWDREHGAAAFARRHGMTVPAVYHWRRKLGTPMAQWRGREEVRRGALIEFATLVTG